MKKRILSLALAVLMLVSLLPLNVVAEGESVTRVEWLQKLIVAFDMEVAEDNYPDNYFSDISSDDDFYRDIMVATNFGFIDTPPGTAFEPNADATREFAAHTLNLALGFRLDEGTEYTFSDAESMTYADDAQIAVNRGWFKLVDGAFAPTTPITAAEAEAMLADAEKVLAGEQIEVGHNDIFTYVDGVIEIPRSAGAKQLDDGRISLSSYKGTLKTGDIIAVYFGVFPTIYRVGVVAADGITVTELESNDYISSMDAEGAVEANLADTEGIGDTQVTYILADGTETQDQKLAKYGSQKVADVNLDKTIDLGEGIKLKLTGRLSNLTFTYKFKVEVGGTELLAKMDGTANFGCDLSADFLKAENLPKSVNLCTIPIKGVAEFKVNALFDLTGEANAQYTMSFMGGFEYKDGMRLLHSFKEESFALHAQVDAKAALKAELGLKNIPLVSGKVWLELGAKARLIAAVHSGLTPEKCLDVSSHIYAVTGYECGVSALFFSKSWKDSYTIWNDDNSPRKVHAHWEDGERVKTCTYGMSEGYGQYGYTTPSDSMYYNNGGADQVSGLYTYTLDNDGYATITGYSGKASSLTLPKTLGGHPVIWIAAHVFEGNTQLRYLTIPEGVTVICSYAFYGCENLMHINFPNSLREIRKYAFGLCNSLTEITLPPNFKALDSRAFCNCKNLQSVFIPASLNDIYEWTDDDPTGPFFGCDALTQVTFEEGMTTIVASLFEGCTGLTEITIPETVTTIRRDAFQNCKNLKKINFSENLEKIYSYAFAGCDSLTEVILPSSLNELYLEAFRDCKNLQKVFIPAHMIRIGYEAGNYNTVDTVFGFCEKLTEVSFGEGISVIPTSLFSCCTGLESISIPDTVQFILMEAFFRCSSLTNVTIPDSVTSIGRATFKDCTALTDVYYGGSPEEWAAIEIDSENECLTNATIHYARDSHIHHYTDVVTEPTCTEQGYTTHTCSCGESVVDSYVAALGHDIELKYAKAATCTEPGYTGDEFCKTCCETVRWGSTIPAHGHSTEFKNEKEPTCTVAGYSGDEVCKTCGAIVRWGSMIPAHGHSTELKNEKEPTCTVAGYSGDEVCKTCGKIVEKGAEIDAPGHSYKDGVCTVCGAEDPSYQTPHTHSYTDVVTEPTCTQQGYTTHTCDCGESTVDTYVDALGHDYRDGVCTRCGEKDPNYKELLPGDINGDGKVNVLDLIRLKKYLAGAKVELVGSADVNGDGKVNVLDLIRLKKYLAGAKVELVSNTAQVH